MMEKDNKLTEQLIKTEKKIEEKDKLILKSMWIILSISVKNLIAGIFVTLLIVPEGIWQSVTLLGICIMFLIPCFYALKLEINAGVYKCKKCGREIVPTYREALWAMHYGTTRYLKCPDCKKRTWCKKTIK